MHAGAHAPFMNTLRNAAAAPILAIALAACGAGSSSVSDGDAAVTAAPARAGESGGPAHAIASSSTAPVHALTSVCWIETGFLLTNTASGLLVRHSSGKSVLLDGGNSTSFHHEVAVYPASTRLWLDTFPGALAPRTSLPDALRAAGFDPKSLSFFVPSHPHIDHVGGLMDMPDVPVRMTREDMDLVTLGTKSVTFEVVPAHARRIAPLLKELTFDKVPYRGFAESADLLGDKSMIAVRLPGHTPGSIGVFVRIRPDLELFHVGDAATSVKQVEANASTPIYLQRADYDPEETRETQELLHDFHEKTPEVTIIPAHDRTAWAGVFEKPGGCVVP
jgi:glyoxylase-like metal-dependent hydrolase (beta-lactamase superfamily II)